MTQPTPEQVQQWVLPEPHYCSADGMDLEFYTDDQMHEAFAAGRTSTLDEIAKLNTQLAKAQEVIRLQVEACAELKEQSASQHGYFNSVVTECDALQSQLAQETQTYANALADCHTQLAEAQQLRYNQAALIIELQSELAALRTQEQEPVAIGKMVDRFLGWKLPRNFSPDCFISFDREKAFTHPYSGPIGTNLFSADQAREMFEYCCAATTAQEPVNQMLLEALRTARDDIDHWAGYASDYFRNKHNLAADLADIDAAIAAAEGVKHD